MSQRERAAWSFVVLATLTSFSLAFIGPGTFSAFLTILSFIFLVEAIKARRPV